MNATEEAFVRALRNNLDDDDTLLVFADWLDDHGDPRAELLRIQQALSRWVPEIERRQALQQREQVLLAQLEPSWLGPLRDYCTGWKRERGLVTLTLSPRRFGGKGFGRLARDWFSRAWAGGVELHGGSYLGKVMQQAEHLLEVSSLSLSGNNLVSDDIVPILDSPNWASLRHLDLSQNRLDDAVLFKLAASSLLDHLQSLVLRNNRLTSAGLRWLLRAADPAQLRTLDVQGNLLDPPVLRELAHWHARRPTSRSRINSLGMEFVPVPAGEFLLGSPYDEFDRYDDEGPLHPVALPSPYWLGSFQVTQEQFGRVMGSDPSSFTQNRQGGPHHPADSVTWFEAEEFCRRLGELPDEKELGHTYRLPTEAEWEHACRAGTFSEFFFGDRLGSHQANFDGGYPYGGAEHGPYRSRTAPVGCYRPNAFGLFDMHGNVWEWCQDWYEEYRYPGHRETDPRGSDSGVRRVLRGGSWYNNGGSCRSAYRYFMAPEGRDNHVGFRVVLVQGM